MIACFSSFTSKFVSVCKKQCVSLKQNKVVSRYFILPDSMSLLLVLTEVASHLSFCLEVLC